MLFSKVSLLSCQNLFCLNFNNKPFATHAAYYTQHIDRNTGCYNFIVRKSHVAAPQGTSVPRRHSLHEDGLVTWTSNKKSSCWRHHVVNDVPVARDLEVGDGAEVLSDDHSRDDFQCWMTTQTYLPVAILLMGMMKPHHFVRILCILLIRNGLFLSSRSWTMPMHPTTLLVKFWSGNAPHLPTTICETLPSYERSRSGVGRRQWVVHNCPR